MASTGTNGSTPINATVTALVKTAVTDGGLTQQAGDLLVANLNDTVLMGCVGIPVDDLDASEATIVDLVLDASSSMGPHGQTVIDSVNTLIKALQGSKAAASILVSIWTFNERPNLVHGFLPVKQVPPVTSREYHPSGTTALYDTLLATMTGLVSYGTDLVNNGVPNKRILCVFSDGADVGSKRKAFEVRTATDALLQQEAYTFVYVGFGSTDLTVIADEVGFKEKITAAATESEIRRVFHQVSQSIIRASQGVQAGGFF